MARPISMTSGQARGKYRMLGLADYNGIRVLPNEQHQDSRYQNPRVKDHGTARCVQQAVPALASKSQTRDLSPPSEGHISALSFTKTF